MKKPWSAYLRKSFAILVAMAALLFAQNEARAAVAYGAAGAVATGSTSLSVPHPAGIAAGNLLVLVVGNKFSPTNPPSTPAGWTLAGQGAGGLGPTNATDQGPVFSTIFVKEAVGGETGNLAVTLPGGDSSMGRMFRYTKAVGTSWNYAATSGSDNTVDAAWSVTGAANPGITTGDMLIVGSAVNTDGYTFSAESVSAAGATLGTHIERQDSGTTTGRDLRLVVSDHKVTAGTATAAPVFTMTASGTSTNRPTGASVILRIREVILSTTTLDTGSDPVAETIAPGAAVKDVNQFTLQTISGTEAITSVTVNLSTNSGVGRLAITDNAGFELGFTTSPVAGSNIIAVSGMSATTTLTTFKVRVTPLSHALMPAVPGAEYAITAPVTAWAGPNTHAGSDTNPNALTIDNLSPSGATGTIGSAGTGSVTLGWTTSISADFNTTDGSVLYRWATTAGAEVPAEGSAPTVNSVNGAATVACVLSSAASFALSGIIDGTGGSAGCNTTALNPGTAYIYKIFQKDSRGNFDAGVTIGTFTTAAPPTATTNAASGVTPYTATLNGTVSSNGAATTVTFEYGLTTSYGDTIAATPGSLAANAVNTPVSADMIGLNCNTTFHYRVKAANSAGTTNGLDGTFTTVACSAPFSPTACAATRYNGDLGCTAGDVNITGITLASSISSCVSGTPVSLDLDLTVNFAVPDRWDVGIFISNDGKLPTLLPANGGANSCSVAVLPIVPETGSFTFPDLDGVPQGNTGDTCGDGNGAIDDSAFPFSGTVPLGDGVKRMTNVTLPCYASAASGGKLFVPFAVSWDNQKSPVGSLCTSNQYPVPNTSSKCNAPASSVSINVFVLPKIIKTHSGATFNSGDTITYTITVFNDSGGTLQASFFKDPIVANLAVTGLSCTPANGATCPITNNTVADMQGPTGIPIPSANLPNNSSLIFTVTGTLTGSIGQTISNTATVSIGLNTNSSTDSVTLGSASGAKSFAPTSITEGNNSLMTITFTNPTASAVTGVSFLDTYPADLVNAASPGGSTTCGGTPTVTASAGGNTLTFSGGTIPATGSCTVSVYVTSATANSYINSVSFTPGSLGSASATLSVTAAVYGGFNACDVAAIPNASCTNITTPTTSRITTKIAGSPFTLDLVALKTDGTRQTNYNNKTVMVELLDASNNSGALDAYNCRSTWTFVIATLIPDPTFISNGLLTVGPFTIAEAYRDVRVRVTNVGGTTKKGCSTDNFAIRPLAFTVTSTDATQTGTSGIPTFKAGAGFFNLTATAVPGYDGTPAIDNTKVVGTTNPGTISGSFGTASAVTGVATGSSFTYSEVGNFGLNLNAVYDTSFTSNDPAGTDCTDDFSNTLVGGKYGCKIGSNAVAQTTGSSGFGRFVPDHFDTEVTHACGSFTYSGQPFPLTVTARNQGGVTVKNYEGAFAKDATLADANGALGAFSPLSVTADKFVLGVADLTSPASVSFAFTDKLTAPATLQVRATNADAVTSSGFTEGTTPLRSGRLRLVNAYGSELLPIRVPVRAEYYNGTTWTLNTADSCTSLLDSAFALSGGISANTSPSAVTLSGGIGTLTLAKPSPVATGSVDVSANLGITGTSADVSCNTTHPPGTTAANLPWLQFPWCTGGLDPNARIKFGSPKAPYIYLRERY